MRFDLASFTSCGLLYLQVDWLLRLKHNMVVRRKVALEQYFPGNPNPDPSQLPTLTLTITLTRSRTTALTPVYLRSDPLLLSV